MGVVMLGTLSCGDSSTAPLPPAEPTSISVTPATIELESLGATAQLSADVRDQRGWAMPDAAVRWSSGDESVAMVDASGLVTAVGYGEAVVTAMSGPTSGTATVRVAALPPEPVGAIPGRTVEQGRSVTVDASTYFRDPNADADALEYAAASSDETVAEAEVSGSDVTVTGIGPGTATVTVTATDPHGLSASQSFGVVVSGTVEDDFESPASLNNWEADNAEATVADGVLNLTNRTEGRLGIAERREMPSVTEWTIQARMGRTARKASPGVVSLTGHGRFTAVRLVLRTLDDEDRDRDRNRVRDTGSTAASRNYEFAAFDGAAGEWVLVTNLSGGSESVLEEPGEFTDIALGHEGGDFVAYAGESGAEELFRFDMATSSLENVTLGEIVSDLTGFWLVNQSAAGLTALHDQARVTGTGSDAPPSDGAGIADAPDAATRSISVTGPAAERAALEALYRATDGPNWRNSDNWLTDAPLGQWYGVTVNARGRVTRLDLAGRWDSDAQEPVPHGLTGPIPPELGQLTSLTRLDLDANRLSGPVPPELGQLASLEWLDLGDNLLSGPIPSELGRLSELTGLDLWDNSLSGPIPPEFGQLASLITLNLGDNSLSGSIPAEFGQLSTLEYLQLGGNSLSGAIPPGLGRLSNLEALYVWNNNLSGPIPPELGQLSSLGSLGLGGNSLSGPIPPALGQLVNLTSISLWSNELSGPVPPELGRLGKLNYLNFDWNNLSGSVPPELGQLSSVESLLLRGNDLSGSIPPELGRLSSLERLDLGWNDLSGPIPSQLAQLSTLEQLDLGSNSLSGSVPPELGQLPGLIGLVLGGNGLSGPIPPELGDLAGLQALDLGGNRLSASIPPELGKLASLEWLSLSDNELTGPIPPALGDLASLDNLRIRNNRLTGQLPGSFLNLSLRSFHWDENTGLCAPDTGTFRTWLGGIEDHRPGPYCSGAAGRARTMRVEPGEIGPSGAMPGSRRFRSAPPSLFERRGPPPRSEPEKGRIEPDPPGRPAPGSEPQGPGPRGTSGATNSPK